MQKVLGFLVTTSWMATFIFGAMGFGAKVAAAARGEEYATSPYLYASLVLTVIFTTVAVLTHKD